MNVYLMRFNFIQVASLYDVKKKRKKKKRKEKKKEEKRKKKKKRKQKNNPIGVKSVKSECLSHEI